jgi:hypothetical protein
MNYWGGRYVIARSERPGVLVVNFVPDIGNQARIPAESGPIIRVYFDVLPTAPLGGSFLTPADSEIIINHFATPAGGLILPILVGADFDVVPLPYVPGDADGSGYIDLSDINFLINYLFFGGPASSIRNSSDGNGDCTVNVVDIAYLVEYIFESGESPEIGCVECDY